MTEIRIDVDLPHPPDRVWKALTDPQLLRQWFMEVDLDCPAKLITLNPQGVPGFDEPVTGELVEVWTQERIVMWWRAAQLHTLVTITLDPLERGCRVSFVQRGFLGPQGTLRRRVLRRTYQNMVGPGLGGVLDRLVEAERDRANLKRRQAGAPAGWDSRRNESTFFAAPKHAWSSLLKAGRNMTTRRPPSPAGAGQRKRRPPARGVAAPAGEALRESPTTPLSRRSWRRWGFVANRAGSARRRFDPGPQRFGDAAGQPGEYPGSRMATGASAAILVLLTTLALLVDGMLNPVGPDARAGTSGPVTASEPAAETDASAAAKTGGAGIGAVPSSGGVARPPVTLAAAYRTERHVVGGYEAVVTINNLSTQPVDGWSVRIVLPPFGLVVRAVEGAKVEQTEKEVRFSPVAATRVIPAGQPTHFTFQVRGVGAPIECEINDQPCSGVPE